MKWGCEQDILIPLQLDDEVLRRCPLVPFKEEPEWFNTILYQYNFYKEGHWPEPGTWKDQSARLLVLFHIVDAALHDAQDTKRQAAEKRNSQAKASPKNPYPNRSNQRL